MCGFVVFAWALWYTVREELEETARLYLLLRGHNPRCLTPEQVAELEARFPRD